MNSKIFVFIISSFIYFISCSQENKNGTYNFTKADTLRGMLTPLRTCYDVTFYDLRIKLDIPKRSLSGKNTFYFKVTQDFKTCQIDLFDNMTIEKIEYHNRPISYKREYHAVFLYFPVILKEGTIDSFTVYYKGRPREAVRAPWDGGFVWRKDKEKNDWVGVACEGIGASLWWPLKDHLSDEPDSQAISIEVPKNLMAVSNGRLRSVEHSEKTTRFNWFVSYPINSYNITLNVGNYAHLQDTYSSVDGKLTLDYYVLSYNRDKALKHFQQVKNMLKCFEQYFGAYPFQKDGYKLVETEYWGMEHQSCIAYGNNYQNNEWGFDYIIVHESGHEWFGNSISVPDHAEMWIHESFTTYAEAIFMECMYGYEKAVQYLTAQRFNILNQEPILGPLDVNFDRWIGADMYYKGAWMLHTLRSCVNNNELWFQTLKLFCQNFKYRIVNTNQVIQFFNLHLKNDYTAFFEQYLKYPKPPVFLYKIVKNEGNWELHYQWKTDVQHFNMPIEIMVGNERIRLKPTSETQKMVINSDKIMVDKFKFYVYTEKMK
jgi:aminopeptidase N